MNFAQQQMSERQQLPDPEEPVVVSLVDAFGAGLAASPVALACPHGELFWPPRPPAEPELFPAATSVKTLLRSDERH
jgi:hypothetical protein